MILDEMDDYDVYDDVVMNLYDELYDDIYIYIYIIPRMNVLLFFPGKIWKAKGGLTSPSDATRKDV